MSGLLKIGAVLLALFGLADHLPFVETRPGEDLSLLPSGYRLSFMPLAASVECTFSRTLLPSAQCEQVVGRSYCATCD
jgi:hypothetical protein